MNVGVDGFFGKSIVFEEFGWVILVICVGEVLVCYEFFGFLLL